MHHDPTQRPGWVPPHCPNRSCRYHNDLSGGQAPWHYRRFGSYVRSSDRRRVQRFQCGTCGVTFSTQTFSTSYWQKRPELTLQVFPLSVGCMAIRQMARTLGASPQTICEHLSRLARHALLWQTLQLQGHPPQDPLVLDGLHSFEFSQYHPFEHHVLIEEQTSFLLYHTDSELRRSGRMTPYQKRRRAQLEERVGRPRPQSVREDVLELLRVGTRGCEEVVLHSDDHRAYPWAVKRVGAEVDHRVTSSKERRTARNPLYEVNLLDLWIRHAQANHKRETIAASKRRQASAERLAVLQLWRNYVHPRRVNGPPQTPAMLKGLTDRRLTIEEIYRERLFPGRIALPPRWSQYYRRGVDTREYAHNTRHSLKYAF